MPHSEPQAAADEANGQLGELGREVEAFLAQRQQLAQKLAEEIAATEQKLAELKRTAAALFPPESPAPAPAKDRRSKTSTAPKSAKRKANAAGPMETSDEATTGMAAELPASGEATPHEPHLD